MSFHHDRDMERSLASRLPVPDGLSDQLRKFREERPDSIGEQRLWYCRKCQNARDNLLFGEREDAARQASALRLLLAEEKDIDALRLCIACDEIVQYTGIQVNAGSVISGEGHRAFAEMLAGCEQTCRIRADGDKFLYFCALTTLANAHDGGARIFPCASESEAVRLYQQVSYEAQKEQARSHSLSPKFDMCSSVALRHYIEFSSCELHDVGGEVRKAVADLKAVRSTIGTDISKVVIGVALVRYHLACAERAGRRKQAFLRTKHVAAAEAEMQQVRTLGRGLLVTRPTILMIDRTEIQLQLAMGNREQAESLMKVLQREALTYKSISHIRLCQDFGGECFRHMAISCNRRLRMEPMLSYFLNEPLLATRFVEQFAMG